MSPRTTRPRMWHHRPSKCPWHFDSTSNSKAFRVPCENQSLVHWIQEFSRDFYHSNSIFPSKTTCQLMSVNPPIWIWESCCWVMVWKRSCPAVSQICNFTRFPGRGMKHPRKTPWVDHQYINAAILYVKNMYIYIYIRFYIHNIPSIHPAYECRFFPLPGLDRRQNDQIFFDDS